MGLPAKCMHFVGSPGWRGSLTPMSGDGSLFFPEHDETFERAPLETNSLFEAPPEHDGSNEYAVFGCVRARGVILLFNSFTDMRPCAYARGAAGVR